MTVTVEIKSRWSNSVLFSAEVDAGIGERFRLRAALEIAVKANANLANANLANAYLANANLADAYLANAYLANANLANANLANAYLANAYLANAYLANAYLANANLANANLADANLADANLTNANLANANLANAKITAELTLTGKRPLLSIGPIGSVRRTLYAYITNKGLRLRAGCFFGTRDEFIAQLADRHGDNEHANEYTAALALIDCHAELWTPAEKQEAA